MRTHGNRSFLAILLLSGGLALACETPVTRETTVETLECIPAAEGAERQCETVSRETTVESSGGDGCDGIVSCSLTVAGEVIALPFRILGVVLDVVF